jgi:hypothetical protein
VGYFAFPGIDTLVQGSSGLCESTVWDRLLTLVYRHSGISILSLMRVHCVGYFAFPGIDTQVQGLSVLCESNVWDRLLSLA